MKEAENWERFLVDYGFIPSRKERIIRWLIALTINIVWLLIIISK